MGSKTIGEKLAAKSYNRSAEQTADPVKIKIEST